MCLASLQPPLSNCPTIRGVLYANVRSVLPVCPLALAGPIMSRDYHIHNQWIIRIQKIDTHAGIPCRNSILAGVPNWTD
jgi:hypothetical protein